MKKQFGEDYKEKSFTGFSGIAKLSSIHHFTKKNESARKEFKNLTSNKTLSKKELSQYITARSDLWTTLGTRFALPVPKCIEAATNVAYALSLKKELAMIEQLRQQAAVPSLIKQFTNQNQFKLDFANFDQEEQGEEEAKDGVSEQPKAKAEFKEPIRLEQEAFLRAVADRTLAPEVSAEEGLAALECAQKIMRAVKKHKWQEQTDYGTP